MIKKYDYKDCLTNEILQKRFKSQFDLVRYAIKLAVRKVELNKDATYPDLENIATEVLDEIAEGSDSYDEELCDAEEVEEEIVEEELVKVKPKRKVKV